MLQIGKLRWLSPLGGRHYCSPYRRFPRSSGSAETYLLRQGETLTWDLKEEMRQRLRLCYFCCQALLWGRVWGWFWSFFGIIPRCLGWSLLLHASEQFVSAQFHSLNPFCLNKWEGFLFPVSEPWPTQGSKVPLNISVKIVYADTMMPFPVQCIFSSKKPIIHSPSPLKRKESEVAPSCLTLCDPMHCSLPGSFIHGILQGRMLEWVAISFSSGPSGSRDRTQVSHIARKLLTIWATKEFPPPIKLMF